MMIGKPKLKSNLHAEVMGERVLLMTEGRHAALSGGAFAALVPLLNGEFSSDDIVDRLADRFPPTEVYRSLLVLERNGEIEEGGALLCDADAAFWNGFGIDSAKAAAALASRTISVETVGEVGAKDAGTVRAQLLAHGARCERAAGSDLRIVIADDYLREDLAEINRVQLAAKHCWLLVRPNGIHPLVGPLFHPGHTGCWACLAQRLRANRDIEEFARAKSGRDGPYPVRSRLAAVAALALNAAALEATKWVLRGETTLAGRIVSIDSNGLELHRHRLVRRPQCAECGEPLRPDRDAAPLVLKSVPKQYTADGGHRAVSPDETLRRQEHHISPITGVVRGMTRVSEPGDPLVHVYVSGQNFASRHDSLQRLRQSLRSNSCGKGRTDTQARVSALCESIERYSGVFRGEEIRQLARLRDLGGAGIDPRSSMLFSARQYRERERWNALDRRLDAVPLPFEDDRTIEWSPLWSLSRNDVRYLPTGLCYYSYPARAEEFFCMPDSNGAAAGNTVEEAILQGFLELIERDSVALWWYNRLRRPAIDLDSFDDPFVAGLRRHYDRIGRDLWLLDLTGDTGIPAVIAISPRRDGPTRDIIFAPAAHLDIDMAVCRALAELNQMLPGVATAPNGRGYTYDDPEAVHWWRTATLDSEPHLVPDQAVAMRRRGDYPRLATNDIKDDVELCRARVEALGLEMLVLDQTRADIGLPVVKVVVPGLRHFWARFAPGRLFDVPVKLGWTTHATDEAALNPIPIFI